MDNTSSKSIITWQLYSIIVFRAIGQLSPCAPCLPSLVSCRCHKLARHVCHLSCLAAATSMHALVSCRCHMHAMFAISRVLPLPQAWSYKKTRLPSNSWSVFKIASSCQCLQLSRRSYLRILSSRIQLTCICFLGFTQNKIALPKTKITAMPLEMNFSWWIISCF